MGIRHIDGRHSAFPGWRATCTVLLILGAVLLPADVRSQESALPSGVEERVNVYLVELPILATTGTGEPITDLEPEDLLVKERGTRQEITVFERHRRDAPAEPPPRGRIHFNAPDGAPPNEAQGAEPRWFLFLFDLVHGSLRTREQLRLAALEFVQTELPPGDLAAVASFTGQVHLEQNFTTNRDMLRQSVSQAFSRPALPRDGEARMRELLRVVEDCHLQIGRAQSFRAGEECVTAAARNYVREINGVTESYIDTIETLSRLLAGVSGHKYILMFTHGVSLDPTAEAVEAVRAFAGTNWQIQDLRFKLMDEVEYRRAFYAAIEKAVRGGVSIFTLDGSPQPSADFDLSVRQRYRQGAKPYTRAFDMARAGLDELSRNTGGRFFGGSDFLGDLGKAFRATEGSYTIGYYTNLAALENIDKFVDVKVKCLRKNCQISARDGFYFEPRRGSAELGQLTLAPAEIIDGKNFVEFGVTLDPRKFDLIKTDTEVGVNFTMHMRLLTADGRSIADSFHFLSHAYPRSTYDDGTIVAPRYEGYLELPPGEYLFSVMLRDPQAFTWVELVEPITVEATEADAADPTTEPG